MVWLDVACIIVGLSLSAAYVAVSLKQTKREHRADVAFGLIPFPIFICVMEAAMTQKVWLAALAPGLVTGAALLQTWGRPVLLMDSGWFGGDDFASIPRTGSTVRRQLLFMLLVGLLVLGPAFILDPSWSTHSRPPAKHVDQLQMANGCCNACSLPSHSRLRV